MNNYRNLKIKKKDLINLKNLKDLKEQIN